MPALNINKSSSSQQVQYPFPTFQSKVPKPEDLVVLSQPLLKTVIHIGELLKNSSIDWALAGEAGEIISGVNVEESDHLVILSSKEGCDKISQRLVQYQTIPIRIMEKTLARSAEINLDHYPVMIKAYTSEFNIDNVRVVVYGDLQIKVGEWDWGDPLEFEPDQVNVVGLLIPVTPLKIKNELYMGLGWMDRVQKIHEAFIRAHHHIGNTILR